MHQAAHAPPGLPWDTQAAFGSMSKLLPSVQLVLPQDIALSTCYRDSAKLGYMPCLTPIDRPTNRPLELQQQSWQLISGCHCRQNTWICS